MGDLDALEKRNFHLALSITKGQELAHLSGFSVPSEDVQKQEIMDIITKWLTLHNLGVLDEVHRCADWVIHTTRKVQDFDDEQAEASRIYITSFVIATLIHLLDSQLIDYLDKDIVNDINTQIIKRLISGD
jgi:hypothetical protein